MIERVLLRDGVVDLRSRRVWRRASTARLTGSEVEVLAALARVQGQAVDRQELLVRALGHEPDSLSRAVDLCVHRLRHKLERDPAEPAHLVTVQGVGYRLVPADTLEAVRTNLPPARSGIIGRDLLVDEVQAAIQEQPVVLVGPAGVGKTRIAEEIARLAASRWAPAGSWWVDLSEARGEEAVAGAIADAVGVDARGESPTGVVGAVGRALQGRGPCLLVLDTCERSVDEVAAAVHGLATSAWLLLTSRVAIRGARAMEVPQLGIDDAIALLEERVVSAGGRARWAAGTAARLVDAVERLPLGIELAAARLRSLPAARIERELERPLRVLRQPGHEGRQASMEASIGWSWDTLDADGRGALTALCVFRGPIRRDAIEDVLGPGGVEAVASLVRAHLLREVADGVAPWHAVREYAEAHGDRGQLEEARLRHATWVASWADERVDALWGPEFSRALAELASVHADLRAALDHTDAPEVLARLGRALGELDLERGRNAALVARSTALLSRLPEDVLHRSCLWAQLAVAEGRRGRWLPAVDCAGEAVATAMSPFEQVDALHALTVALVRATRPAAAAEAVERALEVAGDEPVLRVRALGAQVVQRFDLRDVPFDPAIARRALEAAVLAGCERVRGRAVNNYAIALIRAGDLKSARPLLEEALELSADQDSRTLGMSHMNLAILYLDTDLDRAVAHAEAALEGFRSAGTRDGEVAALGLCGVFRAAQGETTDAVADLEEALSLNEETQRPLVRAQTLMMRAAALSFAGDLEGARESVEQAGLDGVSRGLFLSTEAATALMRAWSSAEPPPDELLEHLSTMPGDRRWIHAVLLRRRFQG